MVVGIYTKTGDDGTTGLQGNIRRPKSDQRIVAYGCVDEANAAIGVALADMSAGTDSGIGMILTKVQNHLFDLGADLSDTSLKNNSCRISDAMIAQLEEDIDKFDSLLDPLSNFILPGGSRLAAALHTCRAVVRRAETEIVRLDMQEKIDKNCIIYINRLSDLLFVLARTANKQDGIGDVLWHSGRHTA